MVTNITKPWWKKKRYLIPIGIVVLLSFAGDSNQTQSTQQVAPVFQNVQSATITATDVSASKIPNAAKTITPSTGSTLSNNNYYTNTAGNKVHSPAYSNSVPAGASAQCRDGTYSFSQSRRGTCSHHGGVAMWF